MRISDWSSDVCSSDLIVRSGVLTSVHAFATDPERGFFILILLALAIGGSLTLFAIRAPALQAGGLFAPIRRDGAMVVNNLFLAAACAAVFLGPLSPLFLAPVDGPQSSLSENLRVGHECSSTCQSRL